MLPPLLAQCYLCSPNVVAFSSIILYITGGLYLIISGGPTPFYMVGARTVNLFCRFIFKRSCHGTVHHWYSTVNMCARSVVRIWSQYAQGVVEVPSGVCSQYAWGVVAVPSGCGRSTLRVWSQYPRGVVAVPSGCGRSTLRVWSQYPRGVVAVPSGRGCSTLGVWSQYARGVVAVPSGCCHSTLEVWSRYTHGAIEVRSWCNCGTVRYFNFFRAVL